MFSLDFFYMNCLFIQFKMLPTLLLWKSKWNYCLIKISIHQIDTKLQQPEATMGLLVSFAPHQFCLKVIEQSRAVSLLKPCLIVWTQTGLLKPNIKLSRNQSTSELGAQDQDWILSILSKEEEGSRVVVVLKVFDHPLLFIVSSFYPYDDLFIGLCIFNELFIRDNHN